MTDTTINLRDGDDQTNLRSYLFESITADREINNDGTTSYTITNATDLKTIADRLTAMNQGGYLYDTNKTLGDNEGEAWLAMDEATAIKTAWELSRVGPHSEKIVPPIFGDQGMKVRNILKEAGLIRGVEKSSRKREAGQVYRNLTTRMPVNFGTNKAPGREVMFTDTEGDRFTLSDCIFLPKSEHARLLAQVNAAITAADATVVQAPVVEIALVPTLSSPSRGEGEPAALEGDISVPSPNELNPVGLSANEKEESIRLLEGVLALRKLSSRPPLAENASHMAIAIHRAYDKWTDYSDGDLQKVLDELKGDGPWSTRTKELIVLGLVALVATGVIIAKRRSPRPTEEKKPEGEGTKDPKREEVVEDAPTLPPKPTTVLPPMREGEKRRGAVPAPPAKFIALDPKDLTNEPAADTNKMVVMPAAFQRIGILHQEYKALQGEAGVEIRAGIESKVRQSKTYPHTVAGTSHPFVAHLPIDGSYDDDWAKIYFVDKKFYNSEEGAKETVAALAKANHPVILIVGDSDVFNNASATAILDGLLGKNHPAVNALNENNPIFAIELPKPPITTKKPEAALPAPQPPSPSRGEGQEEGGQLRAPAPEPAAPASTPQPASTSNYANMSFDDFVRTLYGNDTQSCATVPSHAHEQQFKDILMRMRALAGTDPDIKALFDDVSLTYDFIKVFSNENPGFFEEPETMLNLFVHSRFKDAENPRLRTLTADQFVAVYAELRAAGLEREHTVARETLALRDNLRRGMERLERTLREAERIRR